MSDTTPAPTATPSTTDFDDLKLPQNFDSLLHAKRVLTAIPLRKPYKHDWVRTHPTWQQPASVLKLRGERADELWLICNALGGGLPDDLITGMVFTPTINRQAALTMWPLRMPAANGRADMWAQTAIEIAQVARERWVQVHADLRIGAYTYLELQETVGEPEWPEMAWDAIRELAFRARLITSFDHPVLDAVLRGK